MLIIRQTVITVTTQEVRHCKECGGEFVPVKQKQLFCCKKCYKRQWDRINGPHKKIREYDEVSHPIYACHACGTNTVLDFDPRVDWKAWGEFRCPHCLIEKFID